MPGALQPPSNHRKGPLEAFSLETLTMVGTLQQLMRREENGYVRQRCEKALRLANASAEIF